MGKFDKIMSCFALLFSSLISVYGFVIGNYIGGLSMLFSVVYLLKIISTEQE